MVRELIWKFDCVVNTKSLCYRFSKKTLHQHRALGSLKAACSLSLRKTFSPSCPLTFWLKVVFFHPVFRAVLLFVTFLFLCNTYWKTSSSALFVAVNLQWTVKFISKTQLLI